jgi:glycosyltransferase 2 family protein
VKKLKKVTITLLKGIITAAVIVLLVKKLGWRSIFETIATAQPVWLAAALGIFLISAFLGVVQWRILLQNRGLQLSFGRTFRLYFIGMFFNNFVLGGIVGDALKVASIRSRDGSGKAGFAATFLDRFAGLWAMCGFAVCGSAILLSGNTLSDTKIFFAIAALCVAFALFAGILVFLVFKPAQNLIFNIINLLPETLGTKLKEILSEMLIEAHDYHILIKVAVLSTVIQFLRICVHILCARSLGLLTGNNFHFFFIFVPIIAMLMTLPLPFGIREAAGGTLFSLAGFPTEAAYVMGFLASLVGLAASFLGGLFYILDHTIAREPDGIDIDHHSSSQ